MDALIDVAAEYQDEERPEVRGAWLPATLADADWVLRRMSECQAELSEVDALEAAAIQRVKDRTEKLRRGARRGIVYFESVLKVWMEQNRGALLKGKVKSKSLVYGRVGWRSKGGGLRVVDREALGTWIGAQPQGSPLVRVKLEPDMKALQEHFRVTGEIPPGCEDAPEVDEPYVTPETPAAGLAKREE